MGFFLRRTIRGMWQFRLSDKAVYYSVVSVSRTHCWQIRYPGGFTNENAKSSLCPEYPAALYSLYGILRNSNYGIITSHFDDHTSAGAGELASISRSPSFFHPRSRRDSTSDFRYLFLPPIQFKPDAQGIGLELFRENLLSFPPRSNFKFLRDYLIPFDSCQPKNINFRLTNCELRSTR